jgi:ribosomal protein L7/L12
MAVNGEVQEHPKLPLCFVIGPIGKEGTSERKHADLLLNAVVKHVLETDEFGYKVKRADEDADPGMIGDRVISDIIKSPLVVADLTDLNPNAFYELGIRHSTELPTIHIARLGTVLPFDNVAHRTIFVDLGDWHSTEQARQHLANSARAVTSSEYRVSNPITQANASFKMRQSEDPQDRVLAEMQERMAVIENSIATANQRAEIIEVPHRHETTAQDTSFIHIYNALAAGQKIAAIKGYISLTGAELREAKDFIESLQSGKKIEAIRIHRTGTGLGLKEAKDFVEVLQGAVAD